MQVRDLIIENARQNNLKSISLSLPHNRMIAVTGVSGSGKSSLAFDTIFAEGQWRFIESLSAYARLFLEKLDRPDVDAVRNVRPSIALEQKNPVKGARSTVGTLTEAYDLLRILFARIGVPHCPVCGREIRRWDTPQIACELIANYGGARAAILFRTPDSPGAVRQKGFQRGWKDGEFIDLESFPPDSAERFDIVVDRLVIRDDARLSDSLETAWREGQGRIGIVIFRTEPDEDNREIEILVFSSSHQCDDCRVSVPEPSPLLFSFNHPLCACPECKGFGNVLIYNEDTVIPSKTLSLAQNAVEIWNRPASRWWRDQMLEGIVKSGVNVNIPYCDLSSEQKTLLFRGNGHFKGIESFFHDMEEKKYKLHVRVMLSKYRRPVQCPRCRGARLCDHALAYQIDGSTIADLSALPVSDLRRRIAGLPLSDMHRSIAEEALRQVDLKLRFLERVGLGYLSLNRQAKTLSGGEYQRVNLSNQLAAALTGTLYVLDEPTVGLHPRDTERIVSLLRELASFGNTVIVVEHDHDVISACDWIVELGPEGGHLGGEIVFSGTIGDFLSSGTPTAEYLRRKPENLPDDRDIFASLPPDAINRALTLSGACGNNLKNVTFTVPAGCLTVVTGVSGSGKSSLVTETLYRAMARRLHTETDHSLPYQELRGVEFFRGVRLIDQSPIGKTPRSNVITYLKIFDPIRKIFSQQREAKAHGYSPGFFSFNVQGGRCETCKGEGFQRMELYFFEDVFVRCEDCKGKRYSDAALSVTYRGKNISEVLDMTIDEACRFFGEYPEITGSLGLLCDIGLGYLRIGQPANTFSGGEAQRMKICAELTAWKRSARNILYILDEPTVGLHHRDIVLFMTVIRRLIGSGATVLIIEHNPDVVSQADWVVDLGPEGGNEGGEIIFAGRTEDLVHAKHSCTGRFLRSYLGLPE